MPRIFKGRRAVILLSGSGTNAERLLESIATDSPWRAVALATDRPETSRARELASLHSLPLIELDIKRFYAGRGMQTTSLGNEAGRRIRAEWTDELRRLIAPHNPDFGILAGFIPLTNLTADFPCLNVHPGDLTVEKDGRRILVGLHTIPVEKAILMGMTALRSSVIVAQPYAGGGADEMDSGPILGVSGPITIDMMGHTLQELQTIASRRLGERPAGGYADILDSVARHNQNRLKEGGDWIVFPKVVRDFALGLFGIDDAGVLWRMNPGEPFRIRTMDYAESTDPSPII